MSFVSLFTNLKVTIMCVDESNWYKKYHFFLFSEKIPYG